MSDILNSPARTLSHQSGHKIWATFSFLLLVLWVVLELGVVFVFLTFDNCMNRDGCSFLFGVFYWCNVLIFQLTICLLRERSGHPSFTFRNHCFILLFFCDPHPLYKLFWVWDSVLEKKIFFQLAGSVLCIGYSNLVWYQNYASFKFKGKFKWSLSHRIV